MSKSYGNTIEIFLEGKPLKDKVMSIVTDCAPIEEPKDPDKNNVYNLLKFSFKEEDEEWRKKFKSGGLKYSDVKKRLIQVLEETFKEAREKRKELEKHPDYVEDVLNEGQKKQGK